MQKATILAIGAHPDDIEFGCGGTLIKYSERGHRLFLYIMTEGGLGAETSTRVEEQIASKAILGAEDIFWGGYEDTHLVVDIELIGKIETVIKKVKPDFIFCSYPSEILSSNRFRQFLKEVSKDYNFIFVDAPPVMPVADASDIATLADGVILVYMTGKIGRGVLKRVKTNLENVDAKLTGVILNKVRSDAGGEYYQYHSYYYYGSEPEVKKGKKIRKVKSSKSSKKKLPKPVSRYKNFFHLN